MKSEGKKRGNFIGKFAEKVLTRRPIAAILIWALLLTFILEVLNRRFTPDVFVFIYEKPFAFLFNTVVVLSSLSLALLCPKRVFAVIFMSILWLAMGITNFVVLSFRTTPFSVIDFFLLRSVSDILGVYLNLWQLILIIVLILVVIALLVLLCIKSPVIKTRRWAIFFVLIISGAAIPLGGNVAITRGTLADRYWNLADAYQDYGFVYCFSRSIYDRGIDRPENYSAATVEDILEAIAEDSNAGEYERPNIIMVQLESFFDVNKVKDLTFSQNPIPNFTALKRNYSYGNLTVPSISAGTINTEFEVLSGMNLEYFGAGEYPYKTVLQDTTCETIAYNLKELGYSTHALHNNSGSFYDRHLVYPNLGFDSFTSLEYMENVEYNSLGWAKDSVLTDEILKTLEATPGRDFSFAVSVQSHGRYPEEAVSEPMDISVYGTETEEEKNRWTYYVNQLYGTDQFVGELVNAFSSYDEPVVIVFYGDHLPGIGLEENDVKGSSLYQTEYVIWSNFDIGSDVKRDVTAYQLSAYVLGSLGIDKGMITKLHQRYLSNPNYQQALDLLQYDMLYGEKEVYDEHVRYEPTEMQMGIGELSITKVTENGDQVFVRGSGFTPFTVLRLGERELETTYVSEDLLMAEDVRWKNGENFLTAAMMDGLTVLSESEEFFVKNHS